MFLEQPLMLKTYKTASGSFSVALFSLSFSLQWELVNRSINLSAGEQRWSQ